MIVGFTGAKGCGKSTVFANHLIKKYKFEGVSHADPMKNMLMALGLTKDHVDGPLKDLPCDLLGGRTPRWGLQSIGKEWGRDLMHPDLWIIQWDNNIKGHKRVVADGVRFENEVLKIKLLGGLIIRIRRPSVEGQSSHESELYATTLKADYEIFNEEGYRSKGIEELDEILSQHLK